MMWHRRIGETSDEKPIDSSKVVLRLVNYLRPYRKMVFLALALTLINAVSQGIGPFLIGKAIDGFISQGDKVGLSQTMLLLIFVYLAGMLAMRYQIYFMSLAGQKVLSDLRAEVINKVEQLSLQFLEEKESGDLMSRLVNDIDAINSFFSQGLAQSIGAIFAIAGIVIAMFAINWMLSLSVLMVVPLMVFATNIFARFARRAFRKTRTTIGDVSAGLQEELGGVRVTQAFNRSDVNVQRFMERNRANRDANVSANVITSAFAPAMDVLSAIDTAIVAGFGGLLAVQGVISVGTVVAFLQYVQNFFRPIQTVSSMWTVAQSAFAAAERVFELLDIPLDIMDPADGKTIPEINGDVILRDVSFGYDESELVLEGISLEALPGQTVAIVGPTGAGKTTLVSLIARFYDVHAGAVTIDGFDVRSVTQHSLRSQMGLVTQDPFLFSGSVMENIRYGKLEASDADVYEAAEAANAHRFIEHLPQGYETKLGERGGTLSQGQRQLLSIARAILANPRILILDEATASVDTRTEVLIQKAMNRLLKGRTSFVIAHRLSTVRNADQVLVLDQGRLVERGTHDGLLKLGGLYADLYQRQFYTPEEDGEDEPESQFAIGASFSAAD